MPKKLTYEFVKQKFLESGCELLEDTYIRSGDVMRYICKCGQVSKITYDNFRSGKRCSGCGGNKKHTYAFVKQKFLEGGCQLVETFYENNNTPMKYICECGSESRITYDSFQRGRRCSGCGGSKKLTYEFVKQEFEKVGCQLLENTYINTNTSMKYNCNCGNQSSISFSHFKTGVRCGECAGNKKLTYEFVKQEFEKGGCQLLENTYINSVTLMDYICKCGEVSKIRYSCFRQGYRCSFCKNKTERIVKQFLEENNTAVSQAKFEWCKSKRHLPFDFLIQNFKIIIEVDGPQHFKQISNWQSPEETLRIDKLKSSLAIKNGYSVIRISQEDVFKNTLDWQKMLSDCIKEYDNPVCIYISKDPGLYDSHKSS